MTTDTVNENADAVENAEMQRKLAEAHAHAMRMPLARPCCAHACGSRSASRFSLDARCHVRPTGTAAVRGRLVKALADWK